jgi:glutathione S-transferase
MYKLFYYPRNASWAPHLVLVEMGVDFELILVDRKSSQQKSADYLRLNPTGRIPTLVETNADSKETVIFESAAICLYLCENNPQCNLVPKHSNERAKFFQWLFYLNSSLQPELMVYFYPQKHTTDQNIRAIVEAQEIRISEMFSLIDKELENKEFLVGSSVSVCDYFLFMLSHWASGLSKPPLSFPELGRYLRKISKREAVISVCKTEGTSLDLYQ